jgi:hypothetical protein
MADENKPKDKPKDKPKSEKPKNTGYGGQAV